MQRAVPLFSIVFALAACGTAASPDAGSVPDTGAASDTGPLAVDAASADAGASDAAIDSGPVPYRPDLVCPGGPTCADTGNGMFLAGADKQEITPSLTGRDYQTVDTNSDGNYWAPEGDMYMDANGNGTFDAVWIAGHGSPRAARSVRDPLWARAIALRQNETTVVIVSLDVLGYLNDEMDLIRAAVADLGVDHVMFSATHTHQGPDTVGLWGPSDFDTGVEPAIMANIRAKTVMAIRNAVAALTPATVQHVAFNVDDAPPVRTLHQYVGDSRDPYIVDEEVRVMRFKRRGSTDTIATLVNFGSHPEYTPTSDQRISSSYPHHLRLGIENGVPAPAATVGGPLGSEPGIGGVAVFIQGALGSQIGPSRDLVPTSWSGETFPRHSEGSTITVGEQLAYHVLERLRNGGAMEEDAPRLAVRTRRFFVDVENRGFQIALQTGLFSKQTFNWDPERVLVPGRNEPDIRTEVTVLDVGAAQLLVLPGEVDPALFVEGYDGEHTPMGTPIVRPGIPENEGRDLARAPRGIALRGQARSDARYVWCIGLGNDYTGYFVPEWDFELASSNPWIDEAPGDHYEETRALGQQSWPRMYSEMVQLLDWR